MKLVHVEYCSGQTKHRKNYNDLQEKSSHKNTFVLTTLNCFPWKGNFPFLFSYVWSKSSCHTGVFWHVPLERDFDWFVMGGVSRGMPRKWNIVHLQKFQRSFYLGPIYM